MTADQRRPPPADMTPHLQALYRQMSRADRRANLGQDPQACDDGGEHRWLPVSFRFETQLLDDHGRVRVRQPAVNDAHVYLVCMQCRSWTYIRTEWVGYYLGGPDYSAIGMEDKADNLPDDDPEPDERPITDDTVYLYTVEDCPGCSPALRSWCRAQPDGCARSRKDTHGR